MSGQGPYYGQKAWFSVFHPEKIPSAIERYANEVRRVIGVIELHLNKADTQYLVGDRCMYADLAFVMWHIALDRLLEDAGGIDTEKGFPKFHAWHQRLVQRPAVKKVLADKAEEMKLRS